MTTRDPIANHPPGLDLTSLTAWLQDHVPEVSGDLSAALIAGGKSNLTYLVSDGVSEWIVRRPPLGHVLATAHDMSREYRVMSALQETPVPVPETYALCEDDTVIGSAFYVMERCAGTPFRDATELEALGPRRTAVLATKLVDTLALLHQVEPVAVGLADFGRPTGFLARQVERWKKQLDASYNRDLPGADELYTRLRASVPSESATGIVHGDYRLDNLLIDEGDQVTAVLDWEMATLGDPLTDLALMLTYHRLGGLLNAVTSGPASAPGFLSEEQIVARYAASSGRDLSGFNFYLGLAAYKLAAILEGIHYRHLQGQTVGEGFDTIGEAIRPLLASGIDAIRGNK
jgi:aminoglycoside phosphotransferase (APT) family kinase protein